VRGDIVSAAEEQREEEAAWTFVLEASKQTCRRAGLRVGIDGGDGDGDGVATATSLIAVGISGEGGFLAGSITGEERAREHGLATAAREATSG
jgi:hypothetical protein